MRYLNVSNAAVGTDSVCAVGKVESLQVGGWLNKKEIFSFPIYLVNGLVLLTNHPDKAELEEIRERFVSMFLGEPAFTPPASR